MKIIEAELLDSSSVSRKGNKLLSRQQTGTDWRAPVCVSCIEFTTSAPCSRGCHLRSALLNYFENRGWRSQHTANCVHRRSPSCFERNDTCISGRWAIKSSVVRTIWLSTHLCAWKFTWAQLSLKHQCSHVLLMVRVWRDAGLFGGGLWLCHHPVDPNLFPLPMPC